MTANRKDGNNVAPVSQEHCGELEKAERNAAYLEKLARGLDQVRAGHGIAKTMAALEKMAEEPHPTPEK